MTSLKSKRLGLVIAGFGLLICAQAGAIALESHNVDAQESISVHRELTNAVDAPSGRLILRIPSLSDSNDSNGSPSMESGTPPTEPNVPGSEGQDGPSFGGSSVQGATVFIFDVSASMNIQDAGAGEDHDGNAVSIMSRVEAVKYEAIRMLRDMSEEDTLDFVLLAGAEEGPPGATISPFTDAWMNELTPITDDVREVAIAYVLSLSTWFGTPTYRALERACADYGDDIDRMILLTDGAPWPSNLDDGRSHKDAILEDFPNWFGPLRSNGCDLICFQIGDNAQAGSFLEDLSAQNGASFIHIHN